MHSALKLNQSKAGLLFEGCYFGAIMESAKIAKNYTPEKNTIYIVFIGYPRVITRISAF